MSDHPTPPDPRADEQTRRRADARADGKGLLALLQISDSAFPSGTFTHSFGLEQLVRDGLVRGPVELEAFVEALLRQSTSTADVAALRLAWRCANEEDIEGVVDADRAYLRTKTAPELRSAALATGRRLIEETAAHVEDPLLQSYAARMREDKRLGAQPVAFGVAGCVLGVQEDDAASALLLTTANAILQASMRLLPVSHRDVQGILHRLRPQIASMVLESSPVKSGGMVRNEAGASESRGSRGAAHVGGARGVTPRNAPSFPFLEAEQRDSDEEPVRSPVALSAPDRPRSAAAIRSFHPLQEIGSLRHARGNARLFSS